MDLAKAQNALRLAMSMPAERYAAEQVLSMLGEELELWRARGFSDEAFAAAVEDATGISLPLGLIANE